MGKKKLYLSIFSMHAAIMFHTTSPTFWMNVVSNTIQNILDLLIPRKWAKAILKKLVNITLANMREWKKMSILCLWSATTAGVFGPLKLLLLRLFRPLSTGSLDMNSTTIMATTTKKNDNFRCVTYLNSK